MGHSLAKVPNRRSNQKKAIPKFLSMNPLSFRAQWWMSCASRADTNQRFSHGFVSIKNQMVAHVATAQEADLPAMQKPVQQVAQKFGHSDGSCEPCENGDYVFHHSRTLGQSPYASNRQAASKERLSRFAAVSVCGVCRM